MDLSNENIVHVRNGNIEYLQFKKLLEFDNLVHCYTLKKNLDFRRLGPEDKNDVVENSYKRICEKYKFNTRTRYNSLYDKKRNESRRSSSGNERKRVWRKLFECF